MVVKQDSPAAADEEAPTTAIGRLLAKHRAHAKRLTLELVGCLDNNEFNEVTSVLKQLTATVQHIRLAAEAEAELRGVIRHRESLVPRERPAPRDRKGDPV